MGIIRQGDVALASVRAIPKDAVEQAPTRAQISSASGIALSRSLDGFKLILAFGEATGHHHRFEFLDKSQNIKLYVAAGGTRYLEVSVPSDLLHEEHSTARVPAGKWLLPVQVEYTPAELRRVQD